MSYYSIFAGFWKITDSFPVAIKIYPKRIEGTILEFDLRGNVTWEIHSEATSIPLFKCDSYEIVPASSSAPLYKIKFGAFRGHIINCLVKICVLYFNTITINDGSSLFVCRRLQDSNEIPNELPFSFLEPLQDNYFSDLTLKANNDKKFYVHTCILKLSAPGIDWTNKNNPLSKLPEDVVSGILHYLYAQCLPEEADDAAVNKILSAASEIPGLESLVAFCQLYNRNVTFKKKIISLLTEVHKCGTKLINIFKTKHLVDSPDYLGLNPAKLCFALKKSIQEVALAASKLFVICDLYTKQKHELSKEDNHEIISHFNIRICVFMTQLDTFTTLVRLTFSNLSKIQKRELAVYLLQEMETISDTALLILTKLKFFMEIICTDYEIESNSYDILPKIWEDYLNIILSKKRACYLKKAVREVHSLLVYLRRKKEKVTRLSRGSKKRLIVKELDRFITEDLPRLGSWIETRVFAVKENFKLTENHFCFTVSISKAHEILKKLAANKKSLRKWFVHLCDLVQRDSFVESLMTLGLLDLSENPAEDSVETIQEEKSMNETPISQIPKISTKNYFRVPPPAYRNRLSEAAKELLKLGVETDMVFEIINNGDSDNVKEPNEEEPVEEQPPSSPRPKYSTLPAHRAIVSARCHWFKAALISGMQESIERKIQVYDTTPEIFSVLLEYLYCGQLDYNSLSIVQFSDLLFLSDRYNLDSLKQVCEYGLKPHLDVNSVFYFTSIADRFNAAMLKKACETFIAEHPEILDHNMFKEIPKSLQTAVSDIVDYTKCQPIKATFKKILSSTSSTPEEIKARISNITMHKKKPSSDKEPPSRVEVAFDVVLETLQEAMTHHHSNEVILAAEWEFDRIAEFLFF